MNNWKTDISSYVKQELELPLNPSSWSEEDLKDPNKFYEMTVLLNAQREIADKFLDAQWHTKWRQEKVCEFSCVWHVSKVQLRGMKALTVLDIIHEVTIPFVSS